MSRQQYGGSSGVAGAVMPAQAGLWSYAVPSTGERDSDAPPANTSLPPQKNAPVNQSSYGSKPRQPLANNGNSMARPKTRSGSSKSVDGLNRAYAAAGGLRPPMNNASGNTSEADSLLDLYKPSREDLRSISQERPRVKRKGSRGAEIALQGLSENDKDKWIHRDKLQQIEIQEMIAAGRIYDLPSRSTSRMDMKKMSSDLDAEEQDDANAVITHDSKRQRVKSPTTSPGGLNEEPERLPDLEPAPVLHARRPSTSRIPVKNNSSSDDTGTSPRSYIARPARSGSQSSQNMLEATTNQSPISTASPKFSTTPQASQNSPPKQRTPARNGAATRGRTVSRGAKSATPSRPRTASSNNANDASPRPGTSGDGSRPPTARPEGDPPWLDNMFKPDPRLPPDQQMLPTHAKRLAEQQRMKQQQAFDPNASPSKYDDLILHDDDESPQPGQAYGNEESESRYDEFETTAEQDTGLRVDTSPPLPQKSSPQIDQGSLRAEEAQRNSPVYQQQQRGSLRSDRSRSPNTATAEHQNGDGWPLRTLTVDKYAREQAQPSHDSPKSDTGSWNANANANAVNVPPTRPNPTSESGSYSLMPTIHGHNHKDSDHRVSQRSGNSNSIATRSSLNNSSITPGVGAQTTTQQQQPIRLPEEPELTENEEKKKKGCAGCCIVM